VTGRRLSEIDVHLNMISKIWEEALVGCLNLQ